jgi:hypothetical protein
LTTKRSINFLSKINQIPFFLQDVQFGYAVIRHLKHHGIRAIWIRSNTALKHHGILTLGTGDVTVNIHSNTWLIRPMFCEISCSQNDCRDDEGNKYL